MDTQQQRLVGINGVRVAIGLLIAAFATGLVLPDWLTPVARWLSSDLLAGLEHLRHWQQQFASATPWPIMTAFISVMLLLAVWLLPPTRFALATSRRLTPAVRDETAMAVGFLLLCEPLMHLGFLWWSGHHPSSVSRDAVFPMPLPGGLASAPWWAGLATILTVSLLVPIAEELFFRGRFFSLVRQWLGGTYGATIATMSITTLAFAAAHGTQVQAMFALPMGVIFSIIRIRSGNVGGCILAHACHNTMFLLLGPMLFAKPWVAPLFALSGVMLVAAAWAHHPATSVRARVPNRWRPLVAAICVTLAFLLIRFTAAWYHQAQDRLWVLAANKVITQWTVDNEVVLQRLDYQRLRGRLSQARCDGLYDCMSENPCQKLPDGNPRQIQVLAQLNPQRLAEKTPEKDIYQALEDLADSRVAWENLTQAARLLAIRSPSDLAAVATANPICLVQWYQINSQKDLCLAQLMRCEGPARRLFLAACERAFPGRVIEVLFILPVAAITPIDRRHLYVHYPDARQRIRTLAMSDPIRAQAWLVE